MDSNKNLYNAQEAVRRIYGYKDQWHSADKSGDKATADKVAKKAQIYYKMLRDSGYANVADALENTNNVGAKYIYENFMKNNSAPTTPTAPTGKAPTVENPTGVPTVKSDMPKAVDTETITGKINDLYGIQRSDRETMAGKYDTLEGYNYNHNPYESEIGKSIMEDYKFKGKTASDNAVASDAGSNGGNIDSYASANANRQQLAFTNAGKQVVLNDFNTRIQNARNILNDLGVYQQNQDKGMQTTINQQQTEEQRVFENDETKKNNQVDRDVKTSEVTGYVPESMDYSNNPFFDKDGTLINPDTTDYSQIITNARNKLKTTTDSAEKANLEATIKYATQARAYKILNVPGYSQWASTMEVTSPNETLTSKLTNKEIDTTKAIEESKLATESELTKAELEATERMNNANNATNLELADKGIEAKDDGSLTQDENGIYKNGVKVGKKDGTPILTHDKALEMYAGGNTSEQVIYALAYFGEDIDSTTDAGSEPEIDIETELDTVYNSSSKTVKDYIRNVLKKEITELQSSGVNVDSQWLMNHLISNSPTYDLEVKDIKAISKAFGLDEEWVDDYKNSGLFGWGKGVKAKNLPSLTESETDNSETDKSGNTTNPYLDENGDPKALNYSQIITDAQNKLVITTDPTEIAKLKKTIQNAQEAKTKAYLKSMENTHI